MPRFVLPFALTALAGLAGLWAVSLACAEDPPANPAREALLKAIARGEVLWKQSWGEGSKTCAQCHGPGANVMRSSRLKAYPKYDPTLLKVVTGQQKLAQMIEANVRGQALALGSDDLNALEAYVSTLK